MIFFILVKPNRTFAMKKLKHQFKTFFEQASESIFIASQDSQILDVNEAACHLLGYTKEELTQLTIPDLLSTDEFVRVTPSLEAIAKGIIVKGNWKLKRKDNRIFIGEVSSKKLTDGRLQAIVRELPDYLENEGFNNQNLYFRLTLDHLMEGCQILDFDWRYLYLNRAAEIHNHRPNSELLGNRYQDMWPGIQETEVYCFIKMVLENRISLHLENEFVYPDGALGWFDLSIQPIPEGVFILSIDITERKLAEQTLRENEEKYRLVIDNTSEWIYWMTPQRKLNYISPACQIITGYTADEFIRNPRLIMRITHPLDLPKIRTHFENMRTLDKPHQFEFRIITKQGEIRWISHTCSPILNSDGEFMGRRAVNRNITELKRKEEQLRESELRFAKLYEQGPFGMGIAGDDFKWKSVNSTLEKMLGYSENELKKLTFLEITHPDDRTMNVENVRKIITNEIQIFRSEKRYIRKDGQIFWGALTVTANFNDEGKHLYNLAIIEDINDRKKAEESIESQNALLHAILNSSPEVIIFALDRNFCYTSFNEKHRIEMKETWGVNISVGDNLLSFIHIPEVYERVRKSVERTWTGDSFAEVIYQSLSTRFFEFNWSPISKNGQVVGTTVFVKDVTQAKNAEQALRESEEKFRVIFQSAPDSITITRIHDGMFLAVNKGFTQLFGYTEQEVVGKTAIEVGMVINYEGRDEFVKALQEKGYFENFNIRLAGKDGATKEVLISSSLIYIGGELCIISDSRDITELKRSQEELRKNEALLNEVGRIAKIGGWEYTPSTGVASWTEEVARIHDFDLKTPASIDQSLNYYTEPFRPIIEKAFKDCVELAKPYDLELEIVTETGQSKWVRTIGQPIVENGKVMKVHGAFQDITETVMVRQELIQAKEQAEAADRLKTSFINNISHEVRTPLNGIMGFSQVIIDPGYSLEDKALYGLWLNESCDRLMTTINNIMDLSMLTSKNVKVKKKNIYLLLLLTNAGEGFTFLCQNRNLTVHIDTDKINYDDYIHTDGDVLRKILFQLVDNAVKFTENGSITIGAERKNGDYLFRVSDTGIGISDEYKNQIYDLFIQIDNSITRQYEGSGIGLSIAKGFVNLLGGNIWAESEKGKGSTFYFTIPAE